MDRIALITAPGRHTQIASLSVYGHPLWNLNIECSVKNIDTCFSMPRDGRAEGQCWLM